jgi:phytanoyl-CoA hydroxylase
MIQLKTPRGLPVSVPESDLEDPSPKFGMSELADFAAYYAANGYAVLRGGIPEATCDGIRQLWNSEVKPSSRPIYRQANQRVERHTFNDQGWVMNPILNLQSVDPQAYPAFRKFAAERVLTAEGLICAFSKLFDEQPKIVQSMYFEGNSATWEHQDSYYLDSERVGSMAAAWIAVEDIAADAGRFFVCPGSHLIDLGRQNSRTNIADHHEEYIQGVVGKIRSLALEIRAPALKKGDVLFWNAWTIHGSLDSQSRSHSRSSITCHAIPSSHRFLQLQSRVLPLQLRVINGIEVHHPKDLRSPRNRAVFWVESKFPRVFYPLKRAAIRAMVRKSNG